MANHDHDHGHEHRHDDDDSERVMIKLDGSVGVGPNSLLTIITRDTDGGEREETFLFPHSLIRVDILSKYLDMMFILGYKIAHQEVPTADENLTGGAI